MDVNVEAVAAVAKELGDNHDLRNPDGSWPLEAVAAMCRRMYAAGYIRTADHSPQEVETFHTQAMLRLPVS